MKKFLLCILLILSITIVIPAYASFFSSGDASCNPKVDWCVSVAPDRSVPYGTANVEVKTFAMTPRGRKVGGYIFGLARSTFWLTPEIVTKNKIRKGKIEVVKVIDNNGKKYRLKDCYYESSFPKHKILKPGVVTLLISKTGDNIYACTVVN